jgi:hypothetical protein
MLAVSWLYGVVFAEIGLERSTWRSCWAELVLAIIVQHPTPNAYHTRKQKANVELVLTGYAVTLQLEIVSQWRDLGLRSTAIMFGIVDH